MKKLQLAIMVAALVGAGSANATMVTFNDVAPGQIIGVTIGGGNENGWAGVYNLTVDGVATPSFCIDVNRDITGGQGAGDYSYTALDNAPLAPSGPMSAAGAVDIEKLWAAYYSPSMTDYNAAVLQVAIWEDIATHGGATSVVANDSGIQTAAQALLGTLPSLTAQADLQALVEGTAANPGPLQEFVVAVPEPTTMLAGALLLLPFGASAFRILRRNRIG